MYPAQAARRFHDGRTDSRRSRAPRRRCLTSRLRYGGRIADQPDLITPFARHIRPPQPEGYLLQQLALAGWTSVPWLSRLRQPTLILAATRDPLIHAGTAKLIHRLIPHRRLELIDDWHLFLNEEAVAGTILGFLRDEDPVGQVAADRVPSPPSTTRAN
jgi:pimeloyl-ACP methyl ester carboxylesterase